MIDEYMIYELMKSAADAAVSKTLVELGLKKSHISQREAFKRFGETNVRRWNKTLKVNPHKKGGIIYYDIQELELMKNTNELQVKYLDNERKNVKIKF